MLYIARSLRNLNFSALMNVYSEGNRENAAEAWPDLPEGQRILQAEQGFYQYLHDDFFTVDGAFYAVWVENAIYVSALRLEPYQDGFLLEALETAPEYRCRGYAVALIQAVQAYLGQGKIYSHVSKKNLPSLKVHEKCGFSRVLEHAAYIDGSVNQRACTLCVQLP